MLLIIIIITVVIVIAGHGSRAVKGVHCLRSLGSRDRGFESPSGHGCLVFVYVCEFFCVCVQVEALRRAAHPSKESYRLSLIKKLRKLSPMLQKREEAPKCVGATRKEKNYYYDHDHDHDHHHHHHFGKC
jgi:hypothetical protein